MRIAPEEVLLEPATVPASPALERDSPDDGLFRRGVIFSDGDIPKPPAWFRAGAVDGLAYAAHRATRLAIRRGPSAGILLAGYAICTISGEDDGDAIAERLYRRLIAGEDAFYAELNTLNGRYVVAFRRGGGWRFVNDAAGLRSLFFGQAPSGHFVATHLRLIRMQAPEMPARPRIPHRYAYPGCYTPYRDIFLHNPSTVLRLDDFATTRPFFSAASPRTSPETVADAILTRGRTIARTFARAGDGLVSLTAGADSRLTLACVLPYRDRFEFFTYGGGKRSLRRDAAVGSRIARRFGLAHRTLAPADAAVDPAVGRSMATNALARHGRGVVQACVDAFGVDRKRHIRSNIAEFFLNSDLDTYAGRVGVELADHSAAAAVYGAMAKADAASLPTIAAAFAAWAAHGRVAESRIAFRDVLFVEFRMAGWMSNVLNESDCCFDTLIPFNTREIFGLAAATPLSERRQGLVHRALYRMSGYDLLAEPINGVRW